MNWIPLETIEKLEEIKTRSFEKTVLIFKHSTRCGISRIVKDKFERNVSKSDSDFEFYLLDLLNYRDISNEIASTFQVVHQSPQAIVIIDGRAVANASHYDIITDIEV